MSSPVRPLYVCLTAAVALAACSSSSTVVSVTITSPSKLVVSTIHTTFTSHSGAADDDSRQDFQPPTDDGGTITMSFFHRYTVSRVSGDTDVLVKALDEHGTPIAQGLTTANIVKDEATAVTVAIALIPASGGDGGDNDAGTETDSGTPSDGAIDLSLDLSPDL